VADRTSLAGLPIPLPPVLRARIADLVMNPSRWSSSGTLEHMNSHGTPFHGPQPSSGRNPGHPQRQAEDHSNGNDGGKGLGGPSIVDMRGPYPGWENRTEGTTREQWPIPSKDRTFHDPDPFTGLHQSSLGHLNAREWSAKRDWSAGKRNPRVALREKSGEVVSAGPATRLRPRRAHRGPQIRGHWRAPGGNLRGNSRSTTAEVAIA